MDHRVWGQYIKLYVSRSTLVQISHPALWENWAKIALKRTKNDLFISYLFNNAVHLLLFSSKTAAPCHLWACLLRIKPRNRIKCISQALLLIFQPRWALYLSMEVVIWCCSALCLDVADKRFNSMNFPLMHGEDYNQFQTPVSLWMKATLITATRS